MKKLFILLAFSPVFLFGQNVELCNFVFNSDTVIFFGVDFSRVKFMNIDAYGFSDIPKIKDFYMPKINEHLFDEFQTIDWAPNYFDKTKTYINRNIANQRNATLDIANIMVSNENDCNMNIDSMVSYYCNNVYGNKLGAVLIAETLVKKSFDDEEKSYGVFWLVFFDIQTGKKLITEKMTGNAGGIGWDIFWFKSVKNVLNDIKMKKLRKKYCP